MKYRQGHAGGEFEPRALKTVARAQRLTYTASRMVV